MSALARRRTAGAVVVFILLYVIQFVAFGASPAAATHVPPIPVGYNANCEGLTGIEELLRVPSAGDGVTSDGSAPVTVEGNTYTISWDFHEGNTFDWSTTGGLVLYAVFVKGGPGGGGNLYDYRPGGETSDTGLHALEAGSGYAGLSHITFCGDVENPTTTTTSTVTVPEETTTTTVTVPEETTTTTVTVPEETTTTTVTVPEETTTTTRFVPPPPPGAPTTAVPFDVAPVAVAGIQVTPSSTTTVPVVEAETLPFTGAELGQMALLGVVVLVGGGLLLFGARSRGDHEEDATWRV